MVQLKRRPHSRSIEKRCGNHKCYKSINQEINTLSNTLVVNGGSQNKRRPQRKGCRTHKR